MNQERTKTEQEAARAYLRQFLPAMVLYTAAVMLIIVFVDFDTAGTWKYAVALLPVFPAAWGAYAVAQNVRRIDEMQRRILLRGMAAGFGAAMITAVTMGWLGTAGLDTAPWGPWVIFSAGMLTWLIGSMVMAQEHA